jgi:methyltransferase OMS1
VSARYDSIARTFDTSVDSTERVLRIAALRRKLAARAQGDVLEVSIGTGRNLEYYEWDDDTNNNKNNNKKAAAGKGKGKVKSLTAVDKSAEMLDVARAKLETLGGRADKTKKKNIRWIATDASLPPLPSAPNATQKYDTIIQTMGLCSVSDPVQLLRNLGSIIKEEEGRILLLEHGRGNWKWLNNLLDRFAEEHAREFGCWWNRDLKGIVRESGLHVVDMYSVWWHGGTTWWVELKKSRAARTEEHDVA